MTNLIYFVGLALTLPIAYGLWYWFCNWKWPYSGWSSTDRIVGVILSAFVAVCWPIAIPFLAAIIAIGLLVAKSPLRNTLTAFEDAIERIKPTGRR